MTTFRTPPPIEPLSDLSWHRIERDLFTQLEHVPVVQPQPVPPTRVRWHLAGGIAAAVAVAAVLALLIVSPDDAAHGLQTSRVETADAATAVSLEDAGITVAPNSVMLIHRTADRGVLVALEKGQVDCRVAPREGRPPFVVQSGRVRVEVIGTQFSVARHGDTARVTVDEGVVVVIDDGVRTEVPAGHSWPDETAANDDLDESRADGGRRRSATRDRKRRHKRTRARHDDTDERADSPGVDETGEPPATPTAKEIFAEAAGLESADPDRALALYRDLVAGGGAWAAPALYAQGRLQFELGDRRAAANGLRRYLRRYPEGGNAADARHLLEVIHGR